MEELANLAGTKNFPPVLQRVDDDDENDTGLSDDDWRKLMNAIAATRCTPFLGAGASAGRIRLASVIAEEWAEKEHFPLPGRADLIKVAQYLKVRFGPTDPHDRMAKECDKPRPAFARDELYPVLASLPFPAYITTNYDSLLKYALESEGKQPVQEICRWWNSFLATDETPTFVPGYKPDEKHPLVFHLHGHYSNLDSMVLTEDDYLEFLINLTENRNLLPPKVQGLLANGCMLFLGYSLSDWNFQVVFKKVARYLDRSRLQTHVSVQLNPLGKTASREERERARAYLQKYFGQQGVCVYWGTCDRFARELQERWTEFHTRCSLTAA